jgi:hypothetical protein
MARNHVNFKISARVNKHVNQTITTLFGRA